MPRTMRFDPHSSGHRPFWLVVALAVALLMGVSASTRAAPAFGRAHHAAGIAAALAGIERDLAAARVQLEGIGADAGAADGRPPWTRAAIGPGLGDGGHGFRVRAVETMVASLDRHIERLIALQHRAGDDRGLDIARLMSLDARSAQWGVDELRFVRAAHLVRAARERIGRALDEIGRGAAAIAALQPRATARPKAGTG